MFVSNAPRLFNAWEESIGIHSEATDTEVWVGQLFLINRNDADICGGTAWGIKLLFIEANREIKTTVAIINLKLDLVSAFRLYDSSLLQLFNSNCILAQGHGNWWRRGIYDQISSSLGSCFSITEEKLSRWGRKARHNRTEVHQVSEERNNGLNQVQKHVTSF